VSTIEEKETISQYISDYLSYLEMERGLSNNTILAYQSDLIAFFDYLTNNKEIILDDLKTSN
jgi:site-specific recombinase XerD